MIIAIDFDGTCVMHEYPKIGPPVPLALETLWELQSLGHLLILWTMRSGPTLQDAVDYLTRKGVVLYGVNHNPTQDEWTESPKCYANLYIDDSALGCPLVIGKHPRPYVDWQPIRDMFDLPPIGALQ